MNRYKDAIHSTILSLITIVIALFFTPHTNHSATHRVPLNDITLEQSVNQHKQQMQQTKQAQKKLSNVVHIRNTFKEQVLDSKLPVVVDFYANWCGMCQAVSPIYEQLSLSPQFKGKVKFVSVDIEQFRELAVGYGINAVPSFFFFDKGKQIGQSTLGYMTLEKLSQTIKERFKI
jgi:thioredoxin 1